MTFQLHILTMATVHNRRILEVIGSTCTLFNGFELISLIDREKKRLNLQNFASLNFFYIFPISHLTKKNVRTIHNYIAFTFEIEIKLRK